MICFAFSAVRIDNPEYLITSPVVYRVGKEEKVTVLLVGSKSCEVEVRLRPRGSTWTAVRASGTFEPGERGILKLEVKNYKTYSLKNELIKRHIWFLRVNRIGYFQVKILIKCTIENIKFYTEAFSLALTEFHISICPHFCFTFRDRN